MSAVFWLVFFPATMFGWGALTLPRKRIHYMKRFFYGTLFGILVTLIVLGVGHILE